MKYRKRIIILLVVANIVSGFSQNGKSVEEKEPMVVMENAFDFWIGAWEVSWMGSDSTIIKGTNIIEKIVDNKVIQEHFADPTSDFKGTSISVWNPKTKTWHQAWADNQGTYYDFVGEMNGRDRIFKTKQKDGRNMWYRMVFMDIKTDSFIWKWQGRKENTKDWTLLWEIRYRRKS